LSDVLTVVAALTLKH